MPGTAPAGYRRSPGVPRVLVRRGAEPFLRNATGLILDIDGVLLDVSKSYRTTIVETVDLELRRLGCLSGPGPVLRREEIDLYKSAGGLNNDWELASAVVLWGIWTHGGLPKARRRPPGRSSAAHLRDGPRGHAWFARAIERHGGGLAGAKAALRRAEPKRLARAARGCSSLRVRQLFQVLYAGRSRCRALYGWTPGSGPRRGRMETERAMVPGRDLLRAGRPLGIVTGRTRGETREAFRRLGLRGLRRGAVMTADDGPTKPDPRTLWRVADALGVRTALYVGDTRDDLETVARTGRRIGAAGRRFEAILVVPRGWVTPAIAALVRRWRPAAVVPGVGDLLRYLRGLGPPGEG